jgi:multiple sugar transport system permease protein
MTPLLRHEHRVRHRAALGLRLAVLVAFAVFFIVPVLWLVLAPTKTDYQLATQSPFAFGSLGNVARTWQLLDAFGDHLFRRWMENSLVYACSALPSRPGTGSPSGASGGGG